MNYRIYQNIKGWEYVKNVYEEQLKSAVSSLNNETYLLIIKHDISQNMDEVHYIGYAGDYAEKVKIKNDDKQRKKI